MTYSLSSLILDHENIDDEYIDDYACFNNNDLNLDNLAPKTQIHEKNAKEFRNYLENNREMFATSVEQLGCCKNVKFRVETTSVSPVYNAPFREPPALAKIADDELQALEKANIKRKGRAGTWTSQGFVIKQKGGFRFVVNYKNVNSQTKLLKFPLARIDDLLDSFQGAKYFSTIDLRKGFHQFEIEEEDKLGFITKNGVWEYNRMPFGVTNGPTFFSAVMQNILGDLPVILC